MQKVQGYYEDKIHGMNKIIEKEAELAGQVASFLSIEDTLRK